MQPAWVYPHFMSETPDSRPPEMADSEKWKVAAAEFVQSRIELIRLDAREAAQEAAKKAVAASIAAICAAFGWLIVCAGLIGFISVSKPEWPWYHVAFVIAGVHGLVMLIAIAVLRGKSKPAFTLTRSEFAKDQAWLESLKKKR